jgi:hypothetical protein
MPAPLPGLPQPERARVRAAVVITGAHAIIYSRDAEADRAFFRDVLGFSSVDAGGGELGLYEPRHPTPG